LISDDHRYVLSDAINRYGARKQTRKVMEECAELMAAVYHYQDGRCKKAHVAEEIADVIIMCHQLAMIIDEDMVSGFVKSKIERLKERMERCE